MIAIVPPHSSSYLSAVLQHDFTAGFVALIGLQLIRLSPARRRPRNQAIKTQLKPRHFLACCQFAGGDVQGTSFARDSVSVPEARNQRILAALGKGNMIAHLMACNIKLPVNDRPSNRIAVFYQDAQKDSLRRSHS